MQYKQLSSAEALKFREASYSRARRVRFIAVAAIEQTFLRVALLITAAVSEASLALEGVFTVFKRVRVAQGAFTPVIIALVRIAFRLDVKSDSSISTNLKLLSLHVILTSQRLFPFRDKHEESGQTLAEKKKKN